MKNYQVVNGTSYDARTPMGVINALENALRRGTRLLLTYGDTETGESYGDLYMIEGSIGRSTGQHKIPLLIHNSRSLGGPGLSDHCIIRIRTAAGKRLIWKADNFKTPTVELTPSDLPEYSHNVHFNGSLLSRHRSLVSAKRVVSILQ